MPKEWTVRATEEGNANYFVAVTLSSEAEAIKLVADWHRQFDGYVSYDPEARIFDIVFTGRKAA